MNDPDYYQELFVTFNSVFTKQEHAKWLFSDFIWNALGFTKSDDPSYKPRRKLISHAFYASKLKAMSNIIFDQIYNELIKWETKYPDGHLDLVAELAQIQGQIVVSVSIGSEYSNLELPYKSYETGETKMLQLGNFLNAVLGDGAIRDG